MQFIYEENKTPKKVLWLFWGVSLRAGLSAATPRSFLAVGYPLLPLTQASTINDIFQNTPNSAQPIKAYSAPTELCYHKATLSSINMPHLTALYFSAYL